MPLGSSLSSSKPTVPLLIDTMIVGFLGARLYATCGIDFCGDVRNVMCDVGNFCRSCLAAFTLTARDHTRTKIATTVLMSRRCLNRAVELLRVFASQ